MQHERYLSRVEKPARYIGGEAGGPAAECGEDGLRFALAFPEVYEIAMSHMGLKVLHDILGRRPDVCVERVFCPWRDLMDLMYQDGGSPWSLESGRPLERFEVIGFSLQYELTYTNMLHMLRLAGIPLRREDRGAQHPLVIAGGPCMVNPEPVADFLDLVVVGEAEELISELCDLLVAAKQGGWSRERLYRQAMGIEGIYAPAMFEPRYESGRLAKVEALDPEHPTVRRRVVADLNAHQPPSDVVVPLVKAVHDRLGLEIARGCTRGCRFCQAGYIYRPVRERSPEQLLKAAESGLSATGFDELALLSLSSGDYSCIEPLTQALMDRLEPERVSLSLPSLRVDSLSENLAAQIKRVRKTGFTIAPEAGSDRLRAAVNKNLSEDEVLATARRVYGLGWNLIKLYFMVGLPGETDEDIAAMGDLAAGVAAQARGAGRGRGSKPVVNAAVGIFVPKPHTPFQWEPQADMPEARRRLDLARTALARRGVKIKWNPPRSSVLEGVLSRGDRRLSVALVKAVEMGCRFDGWSEELNYDAWMDALAAGGIDPADYLRGRERDEALPWDHIDIGVDRDYLWAERECALSGGSTGDCRDGECRGCGVCDFESIQPRLAQGHWDPPPLDGTAEDDTEFTYLFRLQKTGPIRFLGHLETMGQIARAFRRSGVRVANTQGFHPHPLVKTAGALPLGVESLVERLLVTVKGYPGAEAVRRAVNAALPRGLALAGGRPAGRKEPLPEPDVVTYHIRTGEPLDPACLERFEQSDSWPYVRRTPKGTREMDLKVSIRRMEQGPEGLTVEVGRDGGRPKPAEILESIFGYEPGEALAASSLRIAIQEKVEE
jgi:radical SAM family uncharacterized protein/radical SAM-linked protein